MVLESTGLDDAALRVVRTPSRKWRYGRNM